MEQLRNLLLIALVVVGFLLWQAWQKDYGPKLPPPAPSAAVSEDGTPVPVREEDVPALPTITGQDLAPAPDMPTATTTPAYKKIRVRTDVLDLDINLRGGGIRRLALIDYPVSLTEKDTPFPLMEFQPPNIFLAQSGLRGKSTTVDGNAPDHHAQFTATQSEYTLADGSDTLKVTLHWRSDDGVQVAKVYTFHRGSYTIDVHYTVKNGTSEPWNARMYGQFQRSEVEATGGLFRTYTYTGGVISGPDKPYDKIDFSDMRDVDLKRSQTGGWIAMIQHYFTGAWVPSPEGRNYYYSKAVANDRFVLGVMTPPLSVAPGATGSVKLTLYAGPKVQERLQAVAPNLERTVDYGWLWLIAEPIFWMLNWIHGVIGNWGFSIIALTMLIKLAFFHLSATSYKSMARMRKLQPRVMDLRDRFSGDKQKLNQAMMELYKKEKINPLGGCLPILVQIPVFISLYWVLLESVALRQAPFILWIHDLSVHDPFFVLPVLMGITMLAQQRLNPAPPDPMQARIMMALPFVFTFLFLFFPAGLVLYWFVNNLLSIIQQWVITKKIVGKT
ncbi:MAG: membrane protein insertase YidC [Gammaproteobacteria bacterium]|nr:MAG: membrane protein insertase YidC [Gammaproteobacteria bacterium]